MIQEIGGFFELELPWGEEYHAGAIKVNTGTNALEYILKARKYRKLYIPYYSCDCIPDLLMKQGIDFEYYHIKEDFKPVIRLQIKSDEALLYTNYFGINDANARQVAQEFANIVVDNAQAFFFPPIKSTDSFYSARKFFGVSDGGYVHTTGMLNEALEKDISYGRFGHLLRRIDCGAKSSLELYRSNERILAHQPIKKMSALTERILGSIDYQAVQAVRKRNFAILHEKLASLNELNVNRDEVAAPMVYPLLISIKGLRDFLIKNRIYVATYWKEVLSRVKPNSFEAKLANYLVPLPIDQRYGIEEMERIASTIYLWAGSFIKKQSV
jgi:hypothetical protein